MHSSSIVLEKKMGSFFFLEFLSERISRSDRQLMLSKHQHLILEINEIGSEGSS